MASRTPGSRNPRASSIDSLGPLEFLVLRALWATGPANARQLMNEVNRGKQVHLAYNTYRTVCDRLEQKGLATKTRDGSRNVYRARVRQQAFLRSEARRAARRYLQDFGEVGIAALADQLGWDVKAQGSESVPGWGDVAEQ